MTRLFDEQRLNSARRRVFVAAGACALAFGSACSGSIDDAGVDPPSSRASDEVEAPAAAQGSPEPMATSGVADADDGGEPSATGGEDYDSDPSNASPPDRAAEPETPLDTEPPLDEGSDGADSADLAPTTSAEAEVSFEVDVWPILNSKCSPCHESARAGGHNVGSDDVDVSLRTAIGIEESLIRDIRSGSMPPGCNLLSTDPEDCVSDEEVDLIRDWYAAGSPP